MIDPEAVSAWGETVGGALPPPWNLIAVGATGLVAGMLSKRQKESKR